MKWVPLLLLAGCTLQSPQPDYQSLNLWVSENITSTAADGEEFQTPQETLARGAGDCEDHAYLLLWMVHEMYGVSGELIAYWVGPDDLHAVARIGMVYYDPTTGGCFVEEPERIEFSWGYYELAWLFWVN